jgi:hypothetical protein
MFMEVGYNATALPVHIYNENDISMRNNVWPMKCILAAISAKIVLQSLILFLVLKEDNLKILLNTNNFIIPSVTQQCKMTFKFIEDCICHRLIKGNNKIMTLHTNMQHTHT